MQLSTSAQLAITFGVLAHQAAARVIPQIAESDVLVPGKPYTVNWELDPNTDHNERAQLSLFDTNGQKIKLADDIKLGDGKATVMIPENVDPAPAFAFSTDQGTDYSFRLDGNGGKSYGAQAVQAQDQTQPTTETASPVKQQVANQLPPETLATTRSAQSAQGMDPYTADGLNNPMAVGSNQPAMDSDFPPMTGDDSLPRGQSPLPKPSTKGRAVTDIDSVGPEDPELEDAMARYVDGLPKDGAKNSTSSSRNSTKLGKDDMEDTKTSSKRNKTESTNKTKDSEDSSETKANDKSGTQTLLPSMLYAVVATGITYTLMGSL